MNSLKERIRAIVTIQINRIFNRRHEHTGRRIPMKVMISQGFLQGYVKITDKSKKWPNISESKLRDYEALRSDWEDVGSFIQRGTKEYRENRFRD